jgi:hypothetical protein
MIRRRGRVERRARGFEALELASLFDRIRSVLPARGTTPTSSCASFSRIEEASGSVHCDGSRTCSAGEGVVAPEPRSPARLRRRTAAGPRDPFDGSRHWHTIRAFTHRRSSPRLPETRGRACLLHIRSPRSRPAGEVEDAGWTSAAQRARLSSSVNRQGVGTRTTYRMTHSAKRRHVDVGPTTKTNRGVQTVGPIAPQSETGWIRPSEGGSRQGVRHTKLSASSVLPRPLYEAICG